MSLDRYEWTFRGFKGHGGGFVLRNVSAAVPASSQQEALKLARKALEVCGWHIKHSVAPWRDQSPFCEHWDFSESDLRQWY